MSEGIIFFAVSKISILLLLFTVTSIAQNTNCASSSSFCGNIRISYPFRLQTEASSCGYNDPNFELQCHNNHTILSARSRRYFVQEIDYDYYYIRLVDPNINRANLSSCPLYSNGYDDWPLALDSYDLNIPVSFVHCRAPLNSWKYIKAAFCGNRNSSIVTNFSEINSYIIAGERVLVSDLEESCAVDWVVLASARGLRDNSSLESVYDGLGYGFELSWYRVLCGECDYGYCSLEGNQTTCLHHCRKGTPNSQVSFGCQFEYWLFTTGIWGIIAIVGIWGSFAIAAILALRFLCGFAFLVGLVVHKWRRQHL